MVTMVFPLAIAASGLVQSVATDTAYAGSVSVTVPGCVVHGDDLVGWWRADGDLSAAIGPDGSGSVAFARGLIGNALDFDGSSAVTAEGVTAVSSGVTVDAWVKPSGTGRVEALVSRWDFSSTDDSAHSYALLLLPGGTLLWLTDDTSTRRPLTLAARSSNLGDGRYHHVAATWDDKVAAVYVDGVAIATSPSQGGELNPATTTPVRIGTIFGNGDPFAYKGIIDEPAIARRALDPVEVEALVGAGPNGKCTARR